MAESKLYEEKSSRSKHVLKQTKGESDALEDKEQACCKKSSSKRKKKDKARVEGSELDSYSGKLKREKKRRKNSSSFEGRTDDQRLTSDSGVCHNESNHVVSEGREASDDRTPQIGELLEAVSDARENFKKSMGSAKSKKKSKKKRDKWGRVLNPNDTNQDGLMEIDVLENTEPTVTAHMNGTLDTSSDRSGEYDNRTVCVGGMPYDTTEADIWEMFGKCGTISNVSCTKFADTQRFKGFAFITFETDAAATDALSLDGVNMGGRLIKVERARMGGRVLRAPPKREPGCLSVYIGNLSWDVKVPDIKRFFKGCAIDNVRLAYDRQTGNFRGYGHVDFSDEESLEKAINMDQKQLLGRPVKVSYSVTKGSK
ncbi:hypothetical protein KP509_30G065200 [Ceratopteris richardii]|uniref:RRM domain-containing protein n=1 Tax=Ceratopteris richardii TaxID=49495 RepID=A0A8T2R4U4_CERRI|nr:hypothetical protein KP509_30G065200 [Ceratopteris richardii]